MKINKKYLLITFIILLIEIFIAIFVKDSIIRPYVGDMLVIILIYTFIRIFISRPMKLLPLYIFIFAVIVEISQYFNFIEMMNLQDNRIISIIAGSTFDIKDIICYLVGTIIIFLLQEIFKLD